MKAADQNDLARLVEALCEQGYTYRELGSRWGVTQTTIMNWRYQLTRCATDRLPEIIEDARTLLAGSAVAEDVGLRREYRRLLDHATCLHRLLEDGQQEAAMKEVARYRRRISRAMKGAA